MNKQITRSLVLILFCLLFILGTIGIVYEHEVVHQNIYKDYGLDSKIHINLDGAYTKVISKGLCPNSCKMAQELNDIIGYPVIVIYGVFGIGILFIIKILIDKNE